MIWLTRSASHARAASLAATRSFVTPLSAETTTIGCCSLRSATMSIAFATRCASPTDVPPNLMTIMMAGSQLAVRGSRSPPNCQPRTADCELSQESLRFQQLSIEQRRACRAADGVVHQGDHAQIEDRAWTETPDGDAHAALPIAIESRLRTIRLADVVQRLVRRRRQPQVLRLAAEVVDRFADVIEIHTRVPQLHRDRHQVTVDHCHAIHLRGNAERCVDKLSVFQFAEDL